MVNDADTDAHKQCQGCTSCWGYPPLFCWKSPIPSGRGSHNFSRLRVILSHVKPDVDISRLSSQILLVLPISSHFAHISDSILIAFCIFSHTSDLFAKTNHPSFSQEHGRLGQREISRGCEWIASRGRAEVAAGCQWVVNGLGCPFVGLYWNHWTKTHLHRLW